MTRRTTSNVHFASALLLASAAVAPGCNTSRPSPPAPSVPSASAPAPAGLLGVGARAPDFGAQDAYGKGVRFDDFRDRTRVVYFYPKDGTPGCTQEAQAFRDADAAFRAKGVAVFGVSRDTEASHAEFRAAHGLTFALAADPEGTIQKAYGVPDMGLPLASRVSFLVGKDGRVQRVFENVDPTTHVNDVLALVP